MGRRSKKKKSRALSIELMSRQIDLPVASFSECPDKTFRQPKRSSVAVTDFSKTSSDDIEDDIPDDWTEREVDEEEDEDDILSISRVKLANCQAEKIEENVSLIQNHGDFWDLLSRYIAPAEVGKFALICKSSYYTVATQGFWRRLYLQHYNPVLHYDLPERFQPDCMRRPKGLRAEVIKMLHQTDRQFLERQSRASSIWPDPHLLTARICSLQTSNRIGKRSVFHYFKLTEVARPKLLTVERSEDSCDEEEGEDIGDKTKTRKLLADLSDIYFNPEEGSKVLQVNAANWSSIPPVMGLKLLSVSLSVSHAMRYHKLKMIFGSPISASCSRSPMDQESSQVTNQFSRVLFHSDPAGRD